MLSRKTKYGLRALLGLARVAGDTPTLVADLARQEGIPQKFLEAILLELKRRGLVDSRKGRGGGYFLRKAPAGDHVRRRDSRAGRPARRRAVRERDRLRPVRRMCRRGDVRRAAGDEGSAGRHGRDSRSHHAGRR